MPCYQINLMSVEFKAENLGILERASKALGWTFSYNKDFNPEVVKVFANSGWMELRIDGKKSSIDRSLFPSLNKLKRKYSELVIEEAARLKRFALRKISEHNYMAVR